MDNYSSSLLHRLTQIINVHLNVILSSTLESTLCQQLSSRWQAGSSERPGPVLSTWHLDLNFHSSATALGSSGVFWQEEEWRKENVAQVSRGVEGERT